MIFFVVYLSGVYIGDRNTAKSPAISQSKQDNLCEKPWAMRKFELGKFLFFVATFCDMTKNNLAKPTETSQKVKK
jgi:hypothetical protein